MTAIQLLPSALIGLASSARSLLPLALVSGVAAGPAVNRPAMLTHPAARLGVGALAIGELLGDKIASAPDRTVLPGLVARAVTGGLAGGALAPRGRGAAGVWLGAGTAILTSFVTLGGRKRAMARIGQTRSGLVEDALVLGLASAAVFLTARRK
ncbi:MAG TPA: hypothetical protein VGN74_14280 [Brevundimonas sp.]|jgi:uncharacterized membrane protein|uniref:hypothetical protein n=1 Tax=Brevundimonas sp. TaxID=1871086 RepID=UPI002E0D1810|nr:hypothetical protein [Brevundimonas sp.]